MNSLSDLIILAENGLQCILTLGISNANSWPKINQSNPILCNISEKKNIYGPFHALGTLKKIEASKYLFVPKKS